MKPTRYQALQQAVDETFDVSSEQWQEINQRVEEIREQYE
jgi:hypothetical protein